MNNLIKTIITIGLIVFFHNRVLADNCPDYNVIYQDRVWKIIDGWEHIPSYWRGSFSGLNKITINQKNNGYLATCFYSSLGENSNRIYRRTYNANNFNGNSVLWSQTSPGNYFCQLQSIDDYADCGYSFS